MDYTISDLRKQDLVGKKVTYLAFISKGMPQTRYDEIWDKLLAVATPVGGFQYSVWKDFKDNDASEILAVFAEHELLEVNIADR